MFCYFQASYSWTSTGVCASLFHHSLPADVADATCPTMLQVLDKRKNEIMEEVMDLLMSFVDFQAFKDLMLAHKMDTKCTQAMQV